VAPRSSDAGRAHRADPFASALDGALNEGRAHAAERVVDRRSAQEDRPSRADHRAETTDQRASDRTDVAAQRVTDTSHRKETRADRSATRAAGREDAEVPRVSTDPVQSQPVADDAAPVASVADEESTEETAAVAEPPRGGLPALWALLMGGSHPATAVVDGGLDAGRTPTLAVPVLSVAAATPLPATPLPATTPADATVVLPAAPAAATTAPGTTAPGTTVAGFLAAGAATAAPAAAATPAGDVLPAGFTAVLADPLGSAAAMPTAPVVTSATAPAAPATAPVAQVDVGVEPTATVPVPAVPLVAPSAPAGPAAAALPTAGATGTAPSSAEAVAPGGTSGKVLPADAGSTGQDGADNAPAGNGATTGTIGPAAPVVPATAAAAVADVDGATGGAAALPVASQVARQVAVLSGGPDGEHSMTLVLTPDTLGEVQVQVTLTKGAIELALRGAHEHGRAALLEALPELRRDLEAAGLSPSRLEVARETGSSLLDRQSTQQQGFGERGGQHDRGENRSRPWGRPADIAGSGSPASNRSTSSGVDVRV
jgi:flagellar hook-length control protein FliK